jgi:hypothetical protein
MMSLRLVVRILVVFSAATISVAALPAAAQRYCTIPCGHRIHRFDVIPCSHPCYGPYGIYPCHAMGDAIPCVHPVHAWDYVPC